MEKLRSICIVYSMKDSFEAYFVKEFFELAGFVVGEYLRESKYDIFQDHSNCNFDIIVNLNSAMSKEEINDLKDKSSSKIYTKNILKNVQNSEYQLLYDLVNDITKDINNEVISKVMEVLYRVYTDNHLVDLLYNYTSVLYQKMLSIFCQEACERFENALNTLNIAMNELPNKSGIEYLMYAIFYCRKMINENLHSQERMERYNIGDLLKEIDNIYIYDSGFYIAEYLKAMVADQSFMYNAQPRFLFENCIRRCNISVCRSNFYYALGKWNENNKRLDNAYKAFRDSYRLDPNSIKSIFKIAIERKRSKEKEYAKKYFQEIIDSLPIEEIGSFPLDNVEFAYKAYMNMSCLVDSSFRHEWESSANYFFDFIKTSEIENIPDSFFIKRMYFDNNYIKAILDAMRCRIELGYEKEVFLLKKDK